MAHIKETPKNIKELSAMANNKLSWRSRIEAIRQLKRYDCEETRRILQNLVRNDRVFAVSKEALKAAQALGIKEKNGKLIYLGKKDIGYRLEDFKVTFTIVKSQCDMDKLELRKFKETMKMLNPEMYDVMLYEKGKKFDSWIREVYRSLPRRK